MQNNPLISVIITTYCRANLLKRAIDSVLSQTYPHIQICVYDNASTDETESLMRKYEKKDSRIVYHRHTQNIGMMPNYKFAFEKITTPLFAFLSDDDYYLPSFLETAVESYNMHPELGFFAASVQATSDQGVILFNPLNNWSREGYFNPIEGMLEMINTKEGKFPIPTGVVFSQITLKEVVPDFRKEIQLMWDPDYLLQIAARYPIFINKKICGIYIAHDEAASSGFYARLHQNPYGIGEYFKAVNKMICRLTRNPVLSDSDKKLAKTLIHEIVKYQMIQFVEKYLKENKNFFALYLTFRLYRNYPFDKRIYIAPSHIYNQIEFSKLIKEFWEKLYPREFLHNTFVIVKDFVKRHFKFYPYLRSFLFKTGKLISSVFTKTGNG